MYNVRHVKNSSEKKIQAHLWLCKIRDFILLVFEAPGWYDLLSKKKYQPIIGYQDLLEKHSTSYI